jgi:hypothetical protein
MTPTQEDPTMNDLRNRLVTTALEWEAAFGVMPRITDAIAELDAALMMGMTIEAYSASMQGVTAVRKGLDFEHEGIRYQVKGNRPSGKPGSPVTKVAKPTNYDWDIFIWMHYTPCFALTEAWMWEVNAYRDALDAVPHLRPHHCRQGTRLA